MRARFENVAVTLVLASVTVSFSLASCTPEFEPGSDETTGAGGSEDGAVGSSGESGANTGANGSAGDANTAGGDSNSAGGAGGAGDAGANAGGSTSHEPGDGGSAGDASSSAAGAGGEAGTENVCDPTKSPAIETCVIDETHGVFVSPHGNDASGMGSRARPFKTLKRAIAEGKASNRRVYACADGGVYAESVRLDAAASGIEMFGGFSCLDWSYDVARKSVVGGAAVTALRVSGVEGLHAEDFEFEGGAGTAPGESSVAVWLDRSIGIRFVRTVIRAGDGADGAAGELSSFEYPLASSLSGNSATGGEDGLVANEKRCECQTAALFSIGGAGGPPGNLAGTAGLPDHGGGEPGPDGSNSCYLRTGDQIVGLGIDGGAAPDVRPAAGASTIGSADRTGWQPARGESGESAGPGQGGGGGASLTAGLMRGQVSRGGGGGCGGCGGNGGGGGGGGGASIALFLVDSEVILSASVLVAAEGGAGGAGSAGQDGQLGGSAGTGAGGGCRGGRGGSGGGGGAGGGGAGGLSAGVVWLGAASPTFDASYVLKGDAGAAGLGGEPGVNDGVAGVAREVLEAN